VSKIAAALKDRKRTGAARAGIREVLSSSKMRKKAGSRKTSNEKYTALESQ